MKLRWINRTSMNKKFNFSHHNCKKYKIYHNKQCRSSKKEHPYCIKWKVRHRNSLVSNGHYRTSQIIRGNRLSHIKVNWIHHGSLKYLQFSIRKGNLIIRGLVNSQWIRKRQKGRWSMIRKIVHYWLNHRTAQRKMEEGIKVLW